MSIVRYRGMETLPENIHGGGGNGKGSFAKRRVNTIVALVLWEQLPLGSSPTPHLLAPPSRVINRSALDKNEWIQVECCTFWGIPSGAWPITALDGGER